MEAQLMLVGTTALFGVAGGVWGLFTAWEQKRKPAPQPAAPVIHVDVPAELQATLERALAKQPAATAVLDLPEPDWHKEMMQDVILAHDRLSVTARQLAKPSPALDQLLAVVVRISEKFDELLAAPPAQPVDESLDLQRKLVQRMAEAIEPLTELPGRISELAGRIKSTSSTTFTTTPPLVVSGGGRSLPPAPKAAPPTPRAAPLPLNMATPSIPAPYVGGSVVVPAGLSQSLLALIQEQLQPNCPGQPAQLTISADESVFVGAASMLGGPLSDTNYAFELTAGGPPRSYGSSFPGHSAPLADLQVFAVAAATLHVEVTT